MKKICIAIHALSHAGAERVAASWASCLARKGHDVFVLIYANYEDAYDLDEKVRVIPVSETPEAFWALPAWKRLWKIRAVIRREAPQVLISFLPKLQINMMLATLGMRMERIETVRNNPWLDSDVGSKRFLWNLCFRRSSRIILQTAEQGEYFGKALRKKCTVISNPLSKDFLKIRKEYAGTVRKFIAVGRLNRQKNYPLMIRAFAMAAAGNTDCTLDIYGMGLPEEIDAAKALIKELGMEERIRLCGWVRNISELLPEYDAFLMSSNYEGMPNALAEAMAAGLVCLSTGCKTGPRDMIDHGKNGYLAPLEDVDAYAEGIRKIMKLNVQQCADVGNAARTKIHAMCSEENTLVRLAELVETVS